ncbi:MAG: twin-arginine translocase TatA/TatE family subunit [Fibrobacter sp.]|nr:twin-arginine translocase TatA/TatE family subunit [Fibrobacter sp.]
MGMIGTQELILICAILVLLFGAKKIPEIASGIGKGIKEFRKASNEVTAELNKTEKEVENKKTV